MSVVRSFTVHLCLTEGESSHEMSLDGFNSRQTPLGRYSVSSFVINPIQSDLIFRHLGRQSRSQRLLLDQLDNRCPVIHELPRIFLDPLWILFPESYASCIRYEYFSMFLSVVFPICRSTMTVHVHFTDAILKSIQSMFNLPVDPCTKSNCLGRYVGVWLCGVEDQRLYIP